MVHASRTIKVNSDPNKPKLTRELVWRGLVMKAENPLPFVPVISKCTVRERGADRLVREIVDKGDTIVENVTFHPQRMVKFERVTGHLALRFTFKLAVEGLPPGGAAESEFAATMEQGYLMAVAATLKAMRELAREDALPAAT
jgi:hypothetical protein